MPFEDFQVHFFGPTCCFHRVGHEIFCQRREYRVKMRLKTVLCVPVNVYNVFIALTENLRRYVSLGQ